MSRGKIIGRTAADLLLALSIGLTLTVLHFANMFPNQPSRDLAFCQGLNSLGVPLTAPGLRQTYEAASVRWAYEMSLDCQAAPADDRPLVEWLRANAGVEVETAERQRGRRVPGAIQVWLRWSGPEGQAMPNVPWEQLGYKAAPPDAPVWGAHAPYVENAPPPAVFRLICVGYIHLGMLIVGLVRWVRNRRVVNESPPRGEGQALPVAIGVAALLACVWWGYVQALRHLAGPGYGLAAYWQCIPSIGWAMQLGNQGVMMTVQPPALQLVAGVIAVLGVPLAQSLFLRGGLQGMWAAAGRVRGGILVAAVAGAVVVLDWPGLPVGILTGLALGWLYRWSRSLLAPLLAHVALNAAVLSMAYGLIPSLPLPVDQLCGRWDGAVDPAAAAQARDIEEKSQGTMVIYHTPPPDVEFVRGGYVRGGVVKRETSERGDWVIHQLTPLDYRWVGREHIEVRWKRLDQRGRAVTVNVDVVRYKVEVSWATLRLTREADGQVLYYYRE